MTPRHLLALCLAVVTQTHAMVPRFKPVKYYITPTAPDFWWDITMDHKANISDILIPFSSLGNTSDPETGALTAWHVGWAIVDVCIWNAGQSATWTTWVWESLTDNEINGGGFIFNKTGEETVLAGVSYLHDGHSDVITWNCFVEGNLTGPLPWDNWNLSLEGDKDWQRKIGFVKEEKQWGFYADSDLVLSKHCAEGMPVVGKRYKFLHGKETEKSVHEDPFKTTHRQKRSPQFFERVGQKLREWVDKAKKFLGIGQQQTDGQDGQDGTEGREGGQRCNTFLDLLVKIINLIFGRRGTPCPPGDAGGVPPQGDSGGDPPGGADVPPADAEDLDPSQNDAVRDWE